MQFQYAAFSIFRRGHLEVTIMDSNYSKWVIKGQIYRSIIYDIPNYITLLHWKAMYEHENRTNRDQRTFIISSDMNNFKFRLKQTRAIIEDFDTRVYRRQNMCESTHPSIKKYKSS